MLTKNTLEDHVIKIYLFYLGSEIGPSLADLLMFATGLKSLPPAGLNPKPQLVFNWTSRFPQGRTCANTIEIPILQTYEMFQDSMSFGIQNSPGFGMY